MKLNFKEILEGWRNDLIPPKDLKDLIQEVSKERLEICSGCPYQSDNAKAAGTYKGFRFDLHCISCGCPLQKKTKSLSSSCPMDKWAAVATDEERYEIEQTIDNETEGNGLQDGSNQSSEGTSESLPESDNI